MPQLEVWIASAQSAALMDDADWRVDLYDEGGAKLVWAGQAFTALPAPQSRWAGAVPPGTYQVEAYGPGGRATHRALALVPPRTDTTVTLLPRPEAHLEPRCDVTITSVSGLAPAGRLTKVEVQGTSEHCETIVVTVTPADSAEGNPAKGSTAVEHGTWSVAVSATRAGIRCGDRVVVVARCRDGDCETVWEGTVECPEPEPEPVPRSGRAPKGTARRSPARGRRT